MAPPENDSSSDSSSGIPTPDSTTPNTPQNEAQADETPAAVPGSTENTDVTSSTEETAATATDATPEASPASTESTPAAEAAAETTSDSTATEPSTEADKPADATETTSTEQPTETTEPKAETSAEETAKTESTSEEAKKDGDDKKEEEKKEEEKKEEKPIVIPSWFLEHQVHLHSSDPVTPPRIRLVNLENGKPSDSTTTTTTTTTTNAKPDPNAIITYDVPSDFYSEAQDVTLWGLRSPESETNRTFWEESAAVLIQSPKENHLDFLNGVVQHLAHDAGADLIALDREEMEDLCRDAWGTRAEDVKKLVEESGELQWFKKKFESEGEEEIKTCERLLEALLGAADKKRGIPDNSEPTQDKAEPSKDPEAKEETPDAKTEVVAEDSQSKQEAETSKDESKTEAAKDEVANVKKETRPLIIQLRDVEKYADESPFKKFYNAVKTARSKGKIVLIAATATSNSTPVYSQRTSAMDKVWDGLKIKGYSLADLYPRLTSEATKALEKREKNLETYKNWRLLRRALRFLLEPGLISDNVLPPTYNDDASVETIKKAFDVWDTNTDGVVGLAHRLSRQLNMGVKAKPHLEPSDVLAMMERITKLKAAMKKCEDGNFSSDSSDSSDGDKGPSKIKKLLDQIEGSCSSTEKEFFDCVVDTDKIDATRDSIRVDQETADSLSQLMRMKTKKHYGLLAQESINGAILYGPPGTGKTHLARVMSKESGTNLLVATPADIESCWVGETEKRIQAMFSLATKLAPCAIFIDEGDSVFKQRGMGDKSWERKAMSQFLSEMDGLSKRKGAPFLFIATNRPGDIDDAVCRRLPHSLHIGLPNVEDRKAIFNIYLKDEKVADDVDVAELAERTKGFSGSDVRTLCVQAALAAERELEVASKAKEKEEKEKKKAEEEKKDAEEGEKTEESKDQAKEEKEEEEKKDDNKEDKKDEEPKRFITKAHFERALSVTRPTVTREALLEIQKFAAQQKKAR
ncbi:hypothetical protein OQA88_13157 [Cercophora sp. LCS_1]